MNFTAGQIAGITLVMAASAFLQGTVGFAFGLFCVPALTLLGLPIQDAIAIAAAGTLVQSAWATFHLRRHIVWRDVGPSVGVRVVFMLAGIWVLAHHLATNQALAKQIIGLVLILFVALLWLCRIQPRERLHPEWGALAFMGSGLMGGLFGMGGPPLVLWATSHNWPNPRTRAFLLTSFLASAPLQMLGLWVAFGDDIAWRLLAGLAFGPVVIVGTQLGLRVGHGLSERRLRMVALGILVVMAATSIADPYLRPGRASAGSAATAPAGR